MEGVEWVCYREREKKKSVGEREMEEKREELNCWYNLYYFNKLYVNIETRILGEL